MELARLNKTWLIETRSKILIGNHLSYKFPIQNDLNHGDALSPLLFIFAEENIIRKVQENQDGLKLNVTHQLLIYADDVNLLRDNVNTIKRNTATLIDVSEKVGLGVNA
jgi:hypothetical protein